MKIIIVTQNEPFFIPVVLKFIVEKYKNYLDSIVFLKPDEYKNKFKSIYHYLKFWGFMQFLKFSIIFLKKLFQKKVDLVGIKVFKNVDINSKCFINHAKKVDYLLSIAANQIFKEDILKAPREMCQNIHASLLPNNKGYNPSFWALYKDENITGITLHKMIRRLDSGPIIIQKKINIRSNETWYSLQTRVANKACQILNELFPYLIKREIKLYFQEGEGSTFRKPQIKHGREFRKKGKKFI